MTSRVKYDKVPYWRHAKAFWGCWRGNLSRKHQEWP